MVAWLDVKIDADTSSVPRNPDHGELFLSNILLMQGILFTSDDGGGGGGEKHLLPLPALGPH